MSWSFIEKTLMHFKFNPYWIKLIMNCVTKGETAILINGTPSTPLNIGRGLRQGDPQSPYLFVLCLEFLSNLINEAAFKNDLEGIKISTNGPTITHLFFADDIILFTKPSNKNCNSVMEILNTFCSL